MKHRDKLKAIADNNGSIEFCQSETQTIDEIYSEMEKEAKKGKYVYRTELTMEQYNLILNDGYSIKEVTIESPISQFCIIHVGFYISWE